MEFWAAKGGASPKQSIKGFGREVGKGSGRGRGSGRGVRAREEVRGSGRAKGLEGERWGGSQEAPPPYTLPSPPPLAQSSFLSCRELSEREGGARHWRHLLSRAKRGRAVPQRKKALGAHGPEPRA